MIDAPRPNDERGFWKAIGGSYGSEPPPELHLSVLIE